MLDAVVSTAALPCPGIELNVEIDVYSFMTTAPNALTDSINHERMPVLLSEEEEFETWLSGSPAEALALARSFDPA
jgi:putative SOS response-associated peptidase YedK